MSPALLVLDDELESRRRMIASLDATTLRDQYRILESGHAFLDACQVDSSALRLVSLDHDLAMDDPLDGLDVTRELLLLPLEQLPSVIVHSSNGERAAIMMGEFELAGWRAERVLPFGKHWIEDDWLATVRERLDTERE
ncbi:MAG: cyclic-phosphate processing receiver domain-containing protein [Planctomycetota bacterium]